MMQIGNGLTLTEEKTHFSMWCMMSTPLMIGCDLTMIPESTLEILKNEEINTMIYTIGAGYGSNFDIKDCEYSKVIIMSDADEDGGHIQCLLLTFFYRYMKPLIEDGRLFVALPPLFKITSGKTVEYAYTVEEMQQKTKGKKCEIQRYKGLGEMNAEQLWETTMNPRKRLLVRISIDDPLIVDNRVSVLMGNDTFARKKWVEENVDFNEVDTFIKEVKK